MYVTVTVCHCVSIQFLSAAYVLLLQPFQLASLIEYFLVLSQGKHLPYWHVLRHTADYYVLYRAIILLALKSWHRRIVTISNGESSTHAHTQSFDGPLSVTTWVSRYQKKHSPTHTHQEDEEGFTQTARTVAWELIPFMVLWASKVC